MNQRVKLTIVGDVIGVGFRAWVYREARKLQLTGWVRNTESSGVEVVAEGERATLIEFVSLCNEGPEISWVEKVIAEWGDSKEEYKEFMIR
jgi:acylphosphatase